MIIEQIEKEIAEFESMAGRRPTYIYLGEHEQDRMRRWANTRYGFQYKELPDDAEYSGLTILKIQVPHHINVG